MGIREDSDEDGFYKAMATDDHLGTVIRGAVYVEEQLIKFIAEATASQAAVKRMSLDYYARVHLAVALGLNEGLLSPLASLGSIRNRFAHTTTAEITDSDATSLYEAMSPDDKQKVQGVYQRMRLRSPKKLPARFSSAAPLERFIFLVISLRGAVLATRLHLERIKAR